VTLLYVITPAIFGCISFCEYDVRYATIAIVHQNGSPSISFALLVVVVFAGLASIPVVAAPTDTMQFQHNAQHTGDYSTVVGPVPPNGQLKWKFMTGGYVGTSPVVANAVV
jgi:hypothetical protein